MEATKEHCYLCFESLQAHLKGEQLPLQVEKGEVPLFVTWKKQGKLRGCIGNLSPVQFPQGLVDYAIRAGTEDSRFPKMKIDELPDCSCGVSLLVDFIPDLKWNEWTPGTHGIVLRFSNKGRAYKATFLPEVAKEQGWNQKETIEALARKSGYEGKISESLFQEMSIERYISSKAEATYSDWIDQ